MTWLDEYTADGHTEADSCLSIVRCSGTPTLFHFQSWDGLVFIVILVLFVSLMTFGFSIHIQKEMGNISSYNKFHSQMSLCGRYSILWINIAFQALMDSLSQIYQRRQCVYKHALFYLILISYLRIILYIYSIYGLWYVDAKYVYSRYPMYQMGMKLLIHQGKSVRIQNRIHWYNFSGFKACI